MATTQGGLCRHSPPSSSCWAYHFSVVRQALLEHTIHKDASQRPGSIPVQREQLTQLPTVQRGSQNYKLWGSGMHHTYSGNDTNCNLIGRATILAWPTKGTAPLSLVMRFGGWVGGCTGRVPPCSACHCGPCPSSSIALGVTECRYVCRSEVTNGACTVRGTSLIRTALGQ